MLVLQLLEKRPFINMMRPLTDLTMRAHRIISKGGGGGMLMFVDAASSAGQPAPPLCARSTPAAVFKRERENEARHLRAS